MRRFKFAGQAQRFLFIHDQVANLFCRPVNGVVKLTESGRTEGNSITEWT
jgi:putative transposase